MVVNKPLCHTTTSQQKNHQDIDKSTKLYLKQYLEHLLNVI